MKAGKAFHITAYPSRQAIAGLGAVLLSLITVLAHAEQKSIYDWTYIHLDYTRQEIAERLERFCDDIHQNASQINDVGFMTEFFSVNDEYFRMQREGKAPADFTRKIEDLRESIKGFYLENFISFYDLLLINTDGDVFYSIRKESDYGRNVFSEPYADSPLSRALKNKPREESFVDFHFYDASDEPAAFFIEPAIKDGKLLGWFALQCAINKVNSIFDGSQQLGKTGEVFLVNKNGFLLTESSFTADDTILKMRLDDGNIRSKFQMKRGHKVVTDYRGFRVLSSFEVFEFMGTQWLIVAKVDESQVITEHYKQHPRYYFDKLAHRLSEQQACTSNRNLPELYQKAIMVDMDEFVKANHGEILRTFGVSTCTALIATYPGKFGYMAHISPYDAIYGESRTNLVDQIVNKIKTYDIYKYQRRQVELAVVTRDLNALKAIVQKLVSEDFLLSQIHVFYYPEAKYANVQFDYTGNRTLAQWLLNDGRYALMTECEQSNLGTIVKALIEE